LLRAIAPSIAALIVAYSMLDERSGWLEELTRWLQPASPGARSRKSVRLGPVGAPVTVTPMRPSGNDTSVSPIPLPLILVRTQPGRNSREGLAQIGVNARSPQTYAAGAILANGARLTEIYEHYVVFDRDDHSVRLYLQGEAQSRGDLETGLLTVGGAAPAAAVVTMTKSQETLTTYLRPSPVFVGGQLRGYALYPGRNPEPFSRLGLQPGDVVTRINGTAISSPADSLAALRTLADGAAITVVLERQGNLESLSLDGAIVEHAMAARPTPAALSTGPETNLKGFFKVDPRVPTRDPEP